MLIGVVSGIWGQVLISGHSMSVPIFHRPVPPQLFLTPLMSRRLKFFSVQNNLECVSYKHTIESQLEVI